MKMRVIFVKGSDIYKAAVAGAKRGYNRSTDDYSDYQRALNGCYEYDVSTVNDPSVRLNIWRKTRGDWRNAYLPVSFLQEHKHIAGEPSEAHARIAVHSDTMKVMDVPLDKWRSLERNAKVCQ
jgi:hypothetical protein